MDTILIFQEAYADKLVLRNSIITKVKSQINEHTERQTGSFEEFGLTNVNELFLGSIKNVSNDLSFDCHNTHNL
ncbi:CLUMA_CG012306, isoform A [Clunio marinus]|uniref:CLUMA_CG012306, isoform A n=1 Tax=Clunio marinus TaxID=568069 RepID=A0A1J1IIG6_9DIPT|nr:CLUMA_CG012306, isoform A [Clunio marinus]